MRREQGNGIEFLKGAAGDEVTFRGTGEKEEWKGISICIADLR